MGFFSKSEPQYDFSFLDKEVSNILSDEKIAIFEDEKRALNSNDV